ncbi:GNAT family N-acetyltransferase [Patescibacteria group bacterium]
MSSRVSKESLAELYEQDLCLLILEQGIVIGFLAAWPVEPGFAEIGSAWIDPGFRAQGLASQLYQRLSTLTGIHGRHCFGVTTNKLSVIAGQHAGLIDHHDWEDPIPWHLTCGPCDKFVSEAQKRSCLLRDNKCWLRIIS